MTLDEPFPLEAVPSRVRQALLREFKGGCPSLRDIDQIPDKQWLATPGIGPACLETIRSITRAGRAQTVSHAAPSLSDAALLKCLEGLQEDLRWLEAELEARMLTGLRHKPHRQRRNRAMRDEADHRGHSADRADASHQRSGRGQVT